MHKLQKIFIMHHSTATMAFVIPVVEHRVEQETA